MKRAYAQDKSTNKEDFGATGKEPRTGTSALNGPLKHRRAVPPGYLHDLLHTRHLMKSVGLQISLPSGQQQHAARKSGPLVAVTNARLAPLPRRTHQPQPSGLRHSLKSLFEQRTKYLERRRRTDRKNGTPYQQHPGKPVGLLSLPEEVLLKIMCYLRHNEVAPMFTVCKQLNQTLKNAIQFHFNYVTPSRGTTEADQTPIILKKRPERRKAVTALADVMAHLQWRRGHSRSLSALVPPATDTSQSLQALQIIASGPRVLSFTPAGTPLSASAPPASAHPSPVGQLRLTPVT